MTVAIGSMDSIPYRATHSRVQNDIVKKIKAKARSFCQTIKNSKDRNENQMPGESRLAPLREVGNGGFHVGQDGIRFIHRNPKLAI